MTPRIRKIILATLLGGLVLTVSAYINAANASNIAQASTATSHAIIGAVIVYALLQLKKEGWW